MTDCRRWARRLAIAAVAPAVVAGIAWAGTAPVHADASVWDRVAACESSGDWSIDTGNGYYGGLQFSLSTWRAFGGGQYAAYPNQASKAEQIAVARKTLAVQGPGAWPVCSQRAGLTRANGAGASTGSTSTASTPAPKRGAPNKAAPKKAAPKKAAPNRVTVRAGDTLSQLARQHRVAGGWQALAQRNRVANPNLIVVGQRLMLP